MDWWQAVILGLVEGITEYLPISSTGHLIIVSSLLGLDQENKSAVDAFNIVIQGGAILAVLGLYRQRVWQMIQGLLGKDAAGRKLALNLIVAFLPAAVLGVLFDDWIEARLFSTGPVIAALALGGVYMIVLDRRRAKREKEDPDRVHVDLTGLTVWHALFIGFMQTVAMWPGTSRSMMTITAGVLVGLKPRQAAEFSFLLGLPTLGGACVYKLGKNLKHAHDTQTANMFETIGYGAVFIGLAVATVSAVVAVRWLVGFLNRHGLEPFGWYRLVLAAVLGTMIALGAVSIGPDASAKDPTYEPSAQAERPLREGHPGLGARAPGSSAASFRAPL
ncbi:undecaprenyl-diphosphate phosphatase [Roseiflexus sp. AH-315-K22]|nr:undecaprenyl-diphosphate phosphatase [Roseiflexus sp. AH-315-K22]